MGRPCRWTTANLALNGGRLVRARSGTPRWPPWGATCTRVRRIARRGTWRSELNEAVEVTEPEASSASQSGSSISTSDPAQRADRARAESYSPNTAVMS